MEPTPRNLLAWIAELNRMEDCVWARNPEDRGEADLLPYLMTRCERSRWEAMRTVVEAMRRRI
jgi:hypothetical protein